MVVRGLNPCRDKAHFCEEHLDVAYGEYIVLLTEYYWIIKFGRRGWAGHGQRGGGRLHTGLLVREPKEKGQLERMILKCILNILGIFRLN